MTEPEGDAGAGVPLSPLDERFTPGKVQSGDAMRAVFAALYEAGRPLTRDELADELLERLDWASLARIRRLHLHQIGSNRRYAKSAYTAIPEPNSLAEVRFYLSARLNDAVMHGTLARDDVRGGDRRYWPTTKAPLFRIEPPPAKRVRYTPEVHAMAVELERTNERSAVARIDARIWRDKIRSLTTEELERLIRRGSAPRMGEFRSRPLLSRVAILDVLVAELRVRVGLDEQAL